MVMNMAEEGKRGSDDDGHIWHSRLALAQLLRCRLDGRKETALDCGPAVSKFTTRSGFNAKKL